MQLFGIELGGLSIVGGLFIALLCIFRALQQKITPWTGRRERRRMTLESGTQLPAEKSPIVIEPFTDFKLDFEDPRKLRNFKPIYHITMGLKTDTPSHLITIDRDYPDRIITRRNLIAQHGHGVHGHVSPTGEAPVRELYTYLLTTYLPVRFPSLFHLSPDKATFHNIITGATFPTTPPPADIDAALRILGETVEEDIFLLKQTAQGHVSVAFMCCFPSGFDPSEKLGKTLKAIHGPVPQYEKIGASMERYFAKLEVGKPVKRTNWSIQTHSELYNCEGNHIITDGGYEKDEQVNIEKTFLRCELQTLTRLPETQAILFSFKTYMYSMSELKAEGLGPELADAIEGLGKGNAPGMWTYKSAVRWGKSVAEYLR